MICTCLYVFCSTGSTTVFCLRTAKWFEFYIARLFCAPTLVDIGGTANTTKTSPAPSYFNSASDDKEAALREHDHFLTFQEEASFQENDNFANAASIGATNEEEALP